MAVLPAIAVLALVGSNTVVAQASPDSNSSSAASCDFKLTQPALVTVSGTPMVTAMLTPGACTGNITVNSWTVCVELQGGDVKPACNFHPWWDPVTVYLSPYRAGATYIATGRGCGNVAPTFEQSCTSLGPYSKIL